MPTVMPCCLGSLWQLGVQVALLMWLKIGPFIQNCMKLLKKHAVLSHMCVCIYSTITGSISLKSSLRNASEMAHIRVVDRCLLFER